MIQTLLSRTRARLGMACAAAVAALAPVTAADYQTTVTALEPVGYWRLNEAPGSPALNSVANVSPLGSVLNGYIVQDAIKGEPGKVGQSVRFSNPGVAAGFARSKIDVPYNRALNKAGAFSVEFWFKPAALGTDATGMAVISSMHNDFVASARTGYLIYVNRDGRFEFRLGNSGGYVGTVNNGSNPSLNARVGEWSHVVGVFTGTQTKIIVNGVEGGTTTLTTAQLNSLQQNTQMAFRFSGTPFTGSLSDGPLISATGTSGNRGVDGWIDETAYYPVALTAAQCAAHFNAANSNPAGYGAAILADNPTAYWPLDEPAYPAPDPGSYPTVANTGTAGASADGTVIWGGLTGQTGAAYSGFGGDANKSVFLDHVNGFVRLPNAPALDITGNITLMAWIKPTVKNFYRDIIARGWDANYAETFLRISRGTDLQGSGFGTDNHYEVGATDGTSYDSVLFPMPEGDIGNWVFVAGTYDGTQWTLYRNGQPVGTKESSIGAQVLPNQEWTIGAQSDADTGGPYAVPGGLTTYFGGNLDEPAIFNKALTAAEIASLYEAAMVPPVITKPVSSPDELPSNTYPTLFQGGSVTLSVVADGVAPLSYQWFLGDSAIAGATTSELALTDIQAGTPTYRVVVTNPNGTASSQVTLNIVVAPPSFTRDPVSVARFAGLPFTLTAETAGSTPQTYQWYKGVDPIPGATSLSYTTTATADLNGASYTVVANNSAGSATSAAAILTVVAPSDYPAALLAQSPEAYWRLGETAGTTAFDYVGNNSGMYFNTTLGAVPFSPVETDRAATFGGDNSYVGQISGTGINFQGADNFTISLWAKGAAGQPDETTLIAKGTGAEGTTGNEQFSIDIAFGHYRFYTRGNNNTIYSAEAAVGPDGTWHHVVGVYDQSNPASPTMRIYVNGELSGTGTGRPEQNGGLRASTAAVSIGSKRLGNAPVHDGTFAGSIDEVAIFPAALTGDEVLAQYAAAYGPNTSPVITVQPRSLTQYATLNATFSVSAYGTVPLSYQWRKGNSDIPGANSSSYTITGLTEADEGEYSVVVSNSAGSQPSERFTLTVLDIPTTTPLIPGLVVHLPFDNSLTDTSGRGNDATAFTKVHEGETTVTTTVPGEFVDGRLGQAFHYASDFGAPTATPGQISPTWNTAYASLGVRPDLQFGTDTDFTFAFWIRLPQDFLGGDLPFFSTAETSLGGHGIVLAPAYGYGNGSGTEPDPAPLNYGGWAVSLYDTGSANGARIYGDVGSINDGGWHHLAYVFERDSQVAVYLDGMPARSYKISGTTTAAARAIDTGLDAAIGQDPTGVYQETGAGDVDDFGVWRRALTPLEVAAIYVAGANNLSYASGTIHVERAGAAIRLLWDAGVLQSSDDVDGPYTDVQGATSPRDVTPDGAMKFYRLRF